jgi:hypothetical protein
VAVRTALLAREEGLGASSSQQACSRDKGATVTDEARVTDDAIRAAKNEVVLRDLNERLKAYPASQHQQFSEWVCDCADMTCSKSVELSIEECGFHLPPSAVNHLFRLRVRDATCSWTRRLLQAPKEPFPRGKRRSLGRTRTRRTASLS